MKRFLVIAVVATMAISLLAGCSTAKPMYKDGTYIAYSDATDKGDYSAEVTIKGDKITAVKIQGYDSLGLPKTAEYSWPEYHQAVQVLPTRFVEKNTWDVDAVAKATSTSNGAKQAVLRAMRKALVTPTTSAKYFDGTYMAISEKAANGWTIAWVTIGGDKITNVTIHSTTPARDDNNQVIEGKFVRKDPEVYGIAQGYTGYKEAKAQLPTRFVAANSAEIDIISGATGTSNQAKEAVAKALANAARK